MIVKRLFDVVMSALGLILLSPLLLAVAVAIRWESPALFFFDKSASGGTEKFFAFTNSEPCASTLSAWACRSRWGLIRA